ncbi:signal peptidase II [bacterium]|nr:signal peptidase II [bacterium]
MNKNKTIIINLAILFLFIIDRISKYLALNKLPSPGVYFFSKIGLEFQKNSGIAFGIKINQLFIIILISIIMIFLINYLVKKWTQKSYWKYFLLALILIGAISNLIDRINYNYVIDFISISRYFPVFNLADLYISSAVLVYLIINYQENKLK